MVLEAYAHQFKKDFTLFLELRAKELVPGGRMVVSLTGTRSNKTASKRYHLWETFAQILVAMVSEVHQYYFYQLISVLISNKHVYLNLGLVA